MLIKKIKQFKDKHAPKGSFKAKVLTLTGGTVIAQAVVLLSSPLLTRLYSPEQFGEFALFISFVSILSVIATGSYQLAINIPKEDDDAFQIFLFVIALTMIFSIVCLLLVAVGHPWASAFFRISKNSLFVAPFGIAFVGCFEAINYWLIRLNRFQDLAFRRVIQFSTMVMVQIVGGFFHWGALGLIGGYLLGQLAACSFFGVVVFHASKQSLMKGWLQWKAPLIRFRNFPLFSLPSSLVNVFANQTPNFLINQFFGSSMLGMFTLPMRYLEAPIALIARSVQDVFKERASRDYRETGTCAEVYMKTLRALVFLGIVPFSVIFIAAPFAVPFIFGEQWAPAGRMTQVLTVMFYFRFVAQPLTYVFTVVEKQNYNLVWQCVLLLVVIGAFMIGVCLNNITTGIVCFSAGYSMMYVWSILWGVWLSRGKSVNGSGA